MDKKTQQMSAWYFIAAITILVLFVQSFLVTANVETINYSQFKSVLKKGQISDVVIGENTIRGMLKPEALNEILSQERIKALGEKAKITNPFIVVRVADSALTAELEEAGIPFKGEVSSNWLTTLLSWVAPVLIFFVVWGYLLSRMGAGGGMMQIGKSKAKVYIEKQTGVTFADVEGIDEAKEELMEVVEFLKHPEKYQRLGGHIPKGVLIVGPPGTGKTLLARAIAGEAGVPFFSISRSDFVEMFVGVGASRVRDLFVQGKKNAPCIVFIDEIDAVGRHRGAGLGGGHDEREQTLNQLLVEMDGFESNEGVILVAATNRPDVLDPALLRPGRFDRRIVVNRPDVKGREGILAVHTKKIPMSDDVDVPVLARGSAGFSGADLANLVNEAALNAARYNQKVVRMLDFEFAKDKVLMGAERRSMIISEGEKRITAIHEAGHALLAVMLPQADPIHKVTIIPRGMALGLTQQLPLDEKHNYSREYLQDQIAILLGGRIAEEITIGSITTGAGNDLERATELARRMVCEWGMSTAMGPLTFGKKEEQIFLGREIAQHQDYSEDTALRIDHEIKRFVTSNYERARTVLEQHKPALLRIAEELLAREVLDAEQVRRILAGEALEEHTPRSVVSATDDGSKRPAKERPSMVPPLPPLNKPLPQE